MPTTQTSQSNETTIEPTDTETKDNSTAEVQSLSQEELEEAVMESLRNDPEVQEIDVPKPAKTSESVRFMNGRVPAK